MSDACMPAVPNDVLEEAMGELSKGVRLTIAGVVRCCAQRRMSARDMRCLLHSVSWQSPTLKSYFEDQMSNNDGLFEVLSQADMMALMASAGRNNEITSENPSQPQIETGEQSESGMWSGQPGVGLDVDTSAQPARRIQSGKTYKSTHQLSFRNLHVRTDLDGLASSAFAELNLHLGVRTNLEDLASSAFPELDLHTVVVSGSRGSSEHKAQKWKLQSCPRARASNAPRSALKLRQKVQGTSRRARAHVPSFNSSSSSM
jgi:hypothetical protein